MKTRKNTSSNFLRKGSLVAIVAIAIFAASCETEEMPQPMSNNSEFVDIPSTIDAMNENPDYFIQENILKGKGKGDVQRFNAQFKTLRAALDYTGLAEAVSENKLTVLAPTDMAFDKLFSTLGITNVSQLPVELVTDILLYHVVPATVYSTDLSAGSSTAPTLLGEDLDVYVANGMVMFDHATVVAADIKAMNGVIHAISNVLLPSALTDGTLYGLASSISDFSILSMAVAKAGLVEALVFGGPFTVFAPTNDAFVALLAEKGWSGLNDIPVSALTQVLLYHVVDGAVYSAALPAGDYDVTTLQGGQFTINKTNLEILDAQNRTAGIAAVDVAASNGVIHIINRVILP